METVAPISVCWSVCSAAERYRHPVLLLSAKKNGVGLSVVLTTITVIQCSYSGPTVFEDDSKFDSTFLTFPSVFLVCDPLPPCILTANSTSLLAHMPVLSEIAFNPHHKATTQPRNFHINGPGSPRPPPSHQVTRERLAVTTPHREGGVRTNRMTIQALHHTIARNRLDAKPESRGRVLRRVRRNRRGFETDRPGRA